MHSFDADFGTCAYRCIEKNRCFTEVKPLSTNKRQNHVASYNNAFNSCGSLAICRVIRLQGDQ